MNTSASLPFVIQSLRPFSTNPSGVGAARVASANASLPDPASDSAYAPTNRDASCGRYRRFTSSLPQRVSALITSVFCTSTSTADRRIDLRERLDREHGVEERSARRRRTPQAPRSPITPSSKSLSISVRGSVACSSISRTSGAISPRANSSTLSRNSRSSSSRVVRARLRARWLGWSREPRLWRCAAYA